MKSGSVPFGAGVYLMKSKIMLDKLAKQTPNLIIEKAIEIMDKKIKKYDFFVSGPDDIRTWLRLNYEQKEREVFGIILLNNTNAILHTEYMFFGTIDRVSVYSREIIKLIIQKNAAFIILVHNHPAGDPKPSDADVEITKKINDAVSLIDVKLVDHLIVGNNDIFSFSERGLLKK
ncbi:conserved hypothetical protein [Xenorhabdus bovienii str. puntauvense]|uniref:MPN domain-containing protein n=2 Tax=Xenorhabdus bovienii TaxID=40576 RepID=A0A077NIK4_XENBV|nr:conserved hypothetical protein [Xenorhabdus bovienii str. puntauvense]